jgi:pimeloyl-ACP methyl ester carboxylesterase
MSTRTASSVASAASPSPAHRPPSAAAADDSAARLAAWAFVTPRRAPQPPPAPAVPGFEARRDTLRVGEDPIAVWQWGEGPAVLLVHGWEGHAGQLAPLAAAAVAAGFRAVAFDMPGHGSAPVRHVTLPRMAAAVAAVATAVGPLHAIVAHSLGGTATILALAAGVEASRVVLLAPPAEPRRFARGVAKVFRLSPAQTEEMMQTIIELVGLSFEAVEAEPHARHMTIPALVLHDPEDREVPFEHGRRIASAWPDARIEAIPGTGHQGPLADPDAIARTVAFLAAGAPRADRDGDAPLRAYDIWGDRAR